MRKLFTFMAAALLASTSVAQQQKRVISRSQVKPVTEAALPNESAAATQRQSAYTPQTTAPGHQTMGAGTVTATDLLVLPNIFGYQNNTQRQVTALPSTGSVAVANRQNVATYGGGGSGNYRYSISHDKGANFAKGRGVINPFAANLGPARYPNSFLFTNGGTDSSAVKMAVLGPYLNTSGAGWVGQVQIAVTDNLTTSPSGTVTQEDYMYPTIGGLLPNSVTQRVPGEYWSIGEPADPAQNPDDNTYLMKGSYNTATDKIDWVLDTLNAPWNLAVDGNAHFNSANIAFSPDGTSGFIVINGDLVGGVDSVYSPVIWEYKNGLWIGPTEINIQFPEIADYIQLWVDSLGAPVSNRGLATTGFDNTIVVDNNGNPHIGLLVGPASTDINGGTLTPYSISSGFGLQIVDLTRDQYGDWNMILLHEQNGFREDIGGSAATVLDAINHVSRSDDGKFIFYTWSDTDTAAQSGAGDNNAPDMWGRMYDVANNMITADLNWTLNDGAWHERARLPKASEYVFDNNSTSACGRSFTVPTTIIDMSDPADGSAPCTIWYFSDVIYDCADATLAPNWLYNCKSSPMALTPTVNSANCGQTNGGFSVAIAGGVAPYAYTVTNASTGVVVPNTNGTVANVGAGTYVVNVIDDKGCTHSQNITVTNPNAPMTTIGTQTNPTCGAANGTATVNVTGGTAPYVVNWYFNGNLISTGTSANNLPNGSIIVSVTDANQCQGDISVTMTGTPGVDAITSASNVICAGDDNGTITVVPSGGIAPYSIQWTSPSGLPADFSLSGLGGGTYTYVVTDNSTPTPCTYSGSATVTEPAALGGVSSSTINGGWNTTNYTGTANVTPSGGVGPYTYAWTMVSNGTNFTVPNNTAAFISGLPGGVATCVITDANGCTFTVDVTVEGFRIGTDKALSNLANFHIFPNPASQDLNINVVLKQADDVRVEIVDMSGKVISSKFFANALNLDTKFDISSVASGMYLIRLNTSKGAITQKLFVQ